MSSRRRRAVCAFLIASVQAVSLAMTSSPSAATHYIHGSNCRFRSATQSAYFGYNDYGVHNANESVGARVMCAFDTDSPTTMGQSGVGANVYVYDRNSGEGVEVFLCDVDEYGVGGGLLCGADASSSLGTDWEILLPGVPTPTGGLTGFVFLEALLPKKTATGASHVVAVDYYD